MSAAERHGAGPSALVCNAAIQVEKTIEDTYSRGVGPCAGRQPEGALPLRPGGDPEDAGARRRGDREHRVRQRVLGRALRGRLLRIQGRGDRAHEVDRARLRKGRDPLQLHLPGLHRHRDGPALLRHPGGSRRGSRRGRSDACARFDREPRGDREGRPFPVPMPPHSVPASRSSSMEASPRGYPLADERIFTWLLGNDSAARANDLALVERLEALYPAVVADCLDRLGIANRFSTRTSGRSSRPRGSPASRSRSTA